MANYWSGDLVDVNSDSDLVAFVKILNMRTKQSEESNKSPPPNAFRCLREAAEVSVPSPDHLFSSMF